MPKPAWRFVLGAGKGIVLDDLEAVSPNGDYLVAGWHGQTSLFDIRASKVIPLTPGRSVTGFSADGERVVYVDHRKLVRRDLASGQSVHLALPEGKPHLIDVDTSGSWAMVTLERRDQEITYGGVDTKFCGGRPTETINAYVPRGVPVWIDLATGEAREDNHIIRIAGGLVFARKDEHLFLDDKPLGPKDCSGGVSLLGVVESPMRALVGCARPKGAKTLVLVAPKGTLVEVDAPLSGTASSQLAPMLTGRELCAQMAGIEDTCIDLTTGAVRRRTAPPNPYGLHDGVWWYAYAETGKMLVGPGENGPLHWQ